jgi:hypothetical protein
MPILSFLSFNINLIASSEQEVFREEVRSLELVKLRLSDRLRDLENELKELKEKNLQDESVEVGTDENC